jgi:multidrug efflux pump subunit AcrA (membrane-fusion protein)
VQTQIDKASDLADVLASLKFRLLKIRLAPDDMEEAQAEIATAIAQLHSPRPKLQIIALSLNTLVSILEQAGPAALTKDVETTLASLRAFLLQWNA